MNTGRTVFSQIMDFLPLREFRKCVKRYRGNYKIQKFSCMDQFLCMAFAQPTYRESLRDIEACLCAMQSKLYHMGIRSRVSRSTLANANEKRDWRIYADFAQVLIHIARNLYAREDFGIESDQTVYVLVSIIKKQLNLDLNLYTILQILSVTLFEKVSILQVLMEAGYKTDYTDSCNQLMLFDL